MTSYSLLFALFWLLFLLLSRFSLPTQQASYLLKIAQLELDIGYILINKRLSIFFGLYFIVFVHNMC